jgi:hypothetical protein
MPRKKKSQPELDLEVYTKSGKLRKRKKKQSRNYFTQETEDAIVEYLKSDDQTHRNKIFVEKIDASLHKLAENIIHTFKFYYTELDNVEDLKHEVVAFLLEKLHHYDQTKGKAYSYFGTIAKRYLIVYNEANYKKLKVRAEIEEVDEDKKIFNSLIKEDENKDLSSFIDSFIKYIGHNINSLFKDKDDQLIVESILQIMRRRENIDVLNKQQLYFFLKEMTGFSTLKITPVIKQLKTIFKQQITVMYHNGQLETDETDIYN